MQGSKMLKGELSASTTEQWTPCVFVHAIYLQNTPAEEAQSVSRVRIILTVRVVSKKRV